MQNTKTGILLSGGIDSIALAYGKRPDIAYTINYGQKPAIAEIYAASQVAKSLNIQHRIIEVDCSGLGSGDLSDSPALSMAPISEWWPFRNQLLITLASMKAIQDQVSKLYIGSVKSDDKHMDGTPSFFNKVDDLMRFQEGNICIEAPGIRYSTLELIKKFKVPNTTLLWAHSCHKSNQPCMQCNGCHKYLYIIQSLGLD